jgi:hypothetical protein
MQHVCNDDLFINLSLSWAFSEIYTFHFRRIKSVVTGRWRGETVNLGPRYCYLPKNDNHSKPRKHNGHSNTNSNYSNNDSNQVIIKGKLLSRITKFRTYTLFRTVISTSRMEKCEEHMWKIFALVWNVRTSICSYYSISRLVFCFLCFSFFFSFLQCIIPLSSI